MNNYWDNSISRRYLRLECLKPIRTCLNGAGQSGKWNEEKKGEETSLELHLGRDVC